MPCNKSRLSLDGIHQFIDFLFAETDCQLCETYSQYDSELRHFEAFRDFAASFSLGVDPHGTGIAQQLSLWSPSVMSEPNLIRIELKVRGHSFRYAVKSCGLFQLHLGGIHHSELTESSLSYWSEAGARQRCTVPPGPDDIDWEAHRKLGGKLSRKFRKLAEAS